MDMAAVKAFGIAFPEESCPVFPRILQTLVSGPEKAVFPSIENSAKLGYFLRLELFPDVRIGNQEYAVRMADQLGGSF